MNGMSAKDADEIESAVAEILAALRESKVNVDLASLLPLQEIASNRAPTLHADGRRSAPTDMELEDAHRSIAAIMPALVGSKISNNLLSEYSFDAIMELGVLPRWVRVQAEALCTTFAPGQAVYDEACVLATLSDTPTLAAARQACNAAHERIHALGLDGDEPEHHGPVGGTVFVAILVFATSTFLVCGDVEGYRKMASQLARAKNQVSFGAEVFNAVMGALNDRLEAVGATRVDSAS